MSSAVRRVSLISLASAWPITLRAGEVAIYKSQGATPETIALDGGVAEVSEKGLTVLAEKADRSRPMTLESDQPCTVSLLKQTSVCSGNVVISQGTLQLRADRLELRETPEGYQMAVAIGNAAKPATYRQKRDSADEVVEGQAQRIDYDSRAGTLRFEGAAVVRRLRGSTVADEIQGALISHALGVIASVCQRVIVMYAGEIVEIGPRRLSAVETVHAMTVHKSQGSEFEHTALVLPPGGAEVLSRELVYTGITRARQQFTLIEAEAGLLEAAIDRPSVRASGLAQWWV